MNCSPKEAKGSKLSSELRFLSTMIAPGRTRPAGNSRLAKVEEGEDQGGAQAAITRKSIAAVERLGRVMTAASYQLIRQRSRCRR
jgi:hypothetical protein